MNARDLSGIGAGFSDLSTGSQATVGALVAAVARGANARKSSSRTTFRSGSSNGCWLRQTFRSLALSAARSTPGARANGARKVACQP